MYLAKLTIGGKVFKVDYVCFAQQTKIDLYLHSVDYLDGIDLLNVLQSTDFESLMKMELFKGRLDSLEVNKHCYQLSLPIKGQNGTLNYNICNRLKYLVEYNHMT